MGRPRATETYCRDETDPIALSGVSDFVADYEIDEMAKWRMAALGKTACHKFDGWVSGGWAGNEEIQPW